MIWFFEFYASSLASNILFFLQLPSLEEPYWVILLATYFHWENNEITLKMRLFGVSISRTFPSCSIHMDYRIKFFNSTRSLGAKLIALVTMLIFNIFSLLLCSSHLFSSFSKIHYLQLPWFYILHLNSNFTWSIMIFLSIQCWTS